MKRALLLLLLTASTPPLSLDKQVDVLAAMLDPAQIEDDNGSGDADMREIETTGCATAIVTDPKTHRIDWTKPAAVMLGDTFVFIDAPPVKLAIVGDASKPDQAKTLSTLAWAMKSLAARCAAPSAGS